MALEERIAELTAELKRRNDLYEKRTELLNSNLADYMRVMTRLDAALNSTGSEKQDAQSEKAEKAEKAPVKKAVMARASKAKPEPVVAPHPALAPELTPPAPEKQDTQSAPEEKPQAAEVIADEDLPDAGAPMVPTQQAVPEAVQEAPAVNAPVLNYARDIVPLCVRVARLGNPVKIMTSLCAKYGVSTLKATPVDRYAELKADLEAILAKAADKEAA